MVGKSLWVAKKKLSLLEFALIFFFLSAAAVGVRVWALLYAFRRLSFIFKGQIFLLVVAEASPFFLCDEEVWFRVHATAASMVILRLFGASTDLWSMFRGRHWGVSDLNSFEIASRSRFACGLIGGFRQDLAGVPVREMESLRMAVPLSGVLCLLSLKVLVNRIEGWSLREV